MKTPSRDSGALPHAALFCPPSLELVAFAFVYASFVLLLKCTVHAALSEYADHSSYRLGALLGWPSDLLTGAILGLPLRLLGGTRWRRGFLRLLATVLATVGLAFVAGFSHYHAFFLRLPSSESVVAYFKGGAGLGASIEAAAPEWAVALELGLGALSLFAVAPLLASRLATRMSHVQRRLGGAIAALACAISLGAASLVPGQFQHGAMPFWLHLATSFPFEAKSLGAEGIDTDRPLPWGITREVLARLGHTAPLEPTDPRFPLCREAGEPELTSHPKPSVILLILESMSAREIGLTYEGQPVMRHLRRIMDRELSFEHFYAPGDKSSEATIALLSGVTEPVGRRLLLRRPLPTLEGLPRDLNRLGYATVYLHGSDLTFEQQRRYLSEVGFADILEPNLLVPGQRVGWGNSDPEMLGQLRDWIARYRTGTASPYFATLFTIGTHDPYELPPGSSRITSGATETERLIDSMAVLDNALGEFYNWYLENEAPNGTILLVTADHSSRVRLPGDKPSATTGEVEQHFETPLIIAGLPTALRQRFNELRRRPGGHLDVPQTILGLAGWHKRGCYQGRDLLSEAPWPQPRYLVSFAGEQLEFMYVHDGSWRWMADLRTRHLEAYDLVADPGLENNLAQSIPERREEMERFMVAYLKLGQYLSSTGRYTNRLTTVRRRTPLPRVLSPIVVSHRGNTQGLGATGQENTLRSMDAALAAGFQWIELDLQLSADGIPVVFHDADLEIEPGRRAVVADLSADQLQALAEAPTLDAVLERFNGKIGLCLELKPQGYLLTAMDLAQQTLRRLDRLPEDAKIIIDSFDLYLAEIVSHHGRWPVGRDLPQAPVQLDWLERVADSGATWAYIRHGFADAKAIAHAHRLGLKVMLYDVDNPKWLESLGGELPDGIMTDYAGPWQDWAPK